MADQLVMLLELLLEESELSVSSMRALQKTYGLQKQDAEVSHNVHTSLNKLANVTRLSELVSRN